MAAIDWTDVEALAPELSVVSTDGQDFILAYVNEALDLSIFGGEESPKLRLARIYLAAHFGKLSSSGGSMVAGPVISETVGDISRSYANLFSSGAGNFTGTAYGDLYMELVRTCARARVPMVI